MDPAHSEDDTRRWWLPLLWGRLDQASVAALLALSCLGIGAGLLVRGYHRGALLEIDRAPPQTVEFRVDINRAAWPELTLLPGVGETLARRIVANREQAGPFLDHADLRRVPGIGPKTLEAIRPYLLPIPPAENVAGR